MLVSIISDTSSLIIFSKLERFDLLANLFDQVLIPSRVYEETLVKEDNLSSMIDANPLFNVTTSKNTPLLKQLDGILDYGEAEAIALAKSFNHPLLIDEKKGREIALGLDIKIIGFLGVLLLNRKKGMLTSRQAVSLVSKAKNFHFRLSASLEKQFMERLSRFSG
jgi:predicted nucleic acid-binding protein